MRLIDHDQVIVAPVYVRQVDVAGAAFVSGEVCVIENVVVESIRCKDVALIVGLVERPVVAQAFGAQH